MLAMVAGIPGAEAAAGLKGILLEPVLLLTPDDSTLSHNHQPESAPLCVTGAQGLQAGA